MAGGLTLLASLLKSVGSKGASIVWENRDHLKLFFKTKFGKHKNDRVRFSISGLYKIQIPNTNDYLLVLNRKIGSQLQPPGGVYKRFQTESLFNSWNYQSDGKRNGWGVDDKSNDDLRFTVDGKYVVDVMNWFDKGEERETEPRREFIEELIETNILDSKTFQNFGQKCIRRYSKNLVWSDYFNCYEVLIYDVFELLPNESQKQALIQLSKEKNDLSKGYAIVSCDDIEQLRLMENDTQVARIGEHTKLLINKTF